MTTQQHKLLIPNWSPELSGLRVAVLADLHVGSPFNGISKLHRIVELTNRLTPDLIVIPGDLVIHRVLGGSFVFRTALNAKLAAANMKNLSRVCFPSTTRTGRASVARDSATLSILI